MERITSPGTQAPQGDADAAQMEAILDLSPLGRIPEASRHELLRCAKLERLARRQQLGRPGEPMRTFVIVGSGRVRVERHEGKRTIPLGHRGPGETVGETALAAAVDPAESAVVMDDTHAVTLPIAALRKLMAIHPAVRVALVDLLVERRLETEERLASLLLYGVELRLVTFLLGALRRWSRPHASGHLITAPFTHADVALVIGSTRETVTLLLGKLRRAGLIDFDHRRVVVRDRSKLEERIAARA